MCGATVQQQLITLPVSGLSPRVRGNHANATNLFAFLGPIPACAGQPVKTSPGRFMPTAYPRVCGATRFLALKTRSNGGLSPRVRGNPSSKDRALALRGPIPACAGQPGMLRSSSGPLWAYPRVCGATAKAVSVVLLYCGLSPRVRGNRFWVGLPFIAEGPIPACAGQPQVRTQRGQRNRAYPRVCGATQSKEERLQHQRGLSPRVRGNPHVRIVVVLTVGPIPACAGQPNRPRTIAPAIRAYPRVCGAARTHRRNRRNFAGLSPRVRGSRYGRLSAGRQFGPIPACAGQPKAADSTRLA